MQRVALDLGQIERAQPLVAVLSAADVEEIGPVRIELVAEPARLYRETDPAPPAAALEQQQVAAVGVDVHQVRVQRAHAQPAQARSITTSLPTWSSVGGIDLVAPVRVQADCRRLLLELVDRSAGRGG